MTADVTGRKFVGAGPGQDLDEIVGRWSADNLGTVLGRDVVELVGLSQVPRTGLQCYGALPAGSFARGRTR